MRSSRARAVALAAMMALAVYAPMTIDPGVDTVDHLIASAVTNLQQPPVIDTSGDFLIIEGPSPSLDATVFPGWSHALNALAFVLVRVAWVFPFSGLPLALYVVVADERRRRARYGGSPPSSSQSYVCLIWQLLSVLFSVGVTGLALEFSGPSALASPVFAYFGMQMVLGMYAVSCWRRRLEDASRLRRERRLFCFA